MESQPFIGMLIKGTKLTSSFLKQLKEAPMQPVPIYECLPIQQAPTEPIGASFIQLHLSSFQFKSSPSCDFQRIQPGGDHPKSLIHILKNAGSAGLNYFMTSFM